LLIEAACYGRVEELRRLIELEGADVNAGVDSTALMRASSNGREAAVEYLLSVGADINKQTEVCSYKTTYSSILGPL
jgi:ankyrin repeat protein